MTRMRSRDKRKARQSKMKRRCETNVSNVGGLFMLDASYQRDSERELTDEEIINISLLARMAFDRILSAPDANVDDFASLAAAINTGYVLCEIEELQDHWSIFVDGQDALAKLWERGHRTNIWRLDGKGVESIRNGLFIYEQISKVARAGELKHAYETVINRVIDGNVVMIERVPA